MRNLLFSFLFVIFLLSFSSFAFGTSCGSYAGLCDNFNGTSIDTNLWKAKNVFYPACGGMSGTCPITTENGLLIQFGDISYDADATYLTSVLGTYDNFNMSVIFNPHTWQWSYYPTSDDQLSGFLFRANNYTYDSQNQFLGSGYEVTLSRRNGTMGASFMNILRYNNDGTRTLLNSVAIDMDLIWEQQVDNQINHTLNVSAIGNQINVLWNDETWNETHWVTLSAIDNTWTSGNVSLITFVGNGAGRSIIENRWSNFTLRSLPLPPLCSCSAWISSYCVNLTDRIQTRTCTPSMCDIQTQYIPDASCQSSQTLGIFFNTQMIVAVVIIGLSAGIAFYVGGDYAWVVFVTMTGIMFLMTVVLGLYPPWILVLAIIVVAGAVMKLILDAIRG